MLLINKPDFKSDWVIFISSFEIISAVVSDPKKLFWIAAFVAAAAIIDDGSQTL